MSKINNIISNHDYWVYLQNNALEEANRPFCSHHFEHLLDVARLTYILILEEGSPFISREITYAAGLLHDIGRWYEYQTEADHALYSADLAEPILIEAGFDRSEVDLILDAIRQHRRKDGCREHRSLLSSALERADGLSRLCFYCKSRTSCNKLERQPHRDGLTY